MAMASLFGGATILFILLFYVLMFGLTVYILMLIIRALKNILTQTIQRKIL